MISRPTPPVSRTVAAIVAGGALVAAMVGAPPPAAALEGETYWATEAGVASRSHGLGSCTVEGRPEVLEDEVLPFVSDEHVVDAEVTVTSSADEADTHSVSLQGRSTIRQVNDGDALDRLAMRASASVSAAAALGGASDCQTSIGMETAYEGYVDMTRDGFLEMTIRTTGDMGGSFRVEQPSTSQGLFLTAGVPIRKRSTAQARLFVEAGTVFFDGFTTLESELPDRPASSARQRTVADGDVAGTAAVDLSFVAAGSAKARAKGRGTTYVSLGGRSCASNRVSTTLTRAAKKAKRVTYLVDGQQVDKVGKPKRGAKVEVPVDAAGDATVKAVVKLRSGGRATVTRSYVACTG